MPEVADNVPLFLRVAQFALQAAVLGLERLQSGSHQTGGQLFELLPPDFEALLVDPQFAGDLPAGLPAHHPMLDRLAFEVDPDL